MSSENYHKIAQQSLDAIGLHLIIFPYNSLNLKSWEFVYLWKHKRSS